MSEHPAPPQPELFPELPYRDRSAQARIALEALLFVAAEPLSISQLAHCLELAPHEIEQALAEVQVVYQGRGIRLQRDGERARFTSAPEAADAIRRMLGSEQSARLSPAALEVLAIVAYRQPITRAQIEALRGVDSSGVVRMLLARDLIVEVGRLETIGRPHLYGTTALFLQQFGLQQLADLPTIDLPEIPPSSGEPAE